MLGTALLALMVVTPTDQTVQVQKGTRLDINNFAGDVSVKVWDKDAVRVEVNHSDRETIDIKQTDQTLMIRSHSSRGPQRSLDYTISIPGWMPITVSGSYTDVSLDGVGSDVTVETTRGDIKVRGGSGFVSLKSVSGEISLEKAKGRFEIRAVQESIRLADLSGDLSAEATNGSIVVDRVDSTNVDLYTVNGNISYDGPLKDKGMYRLTTHNGLIGMAVPEKVNATLMVRTYNGGFRSTFAVKLDDQNPRKRFTLTYGNGSARVELESFGGTIALRRPGEARPETDRKRKPGDVQKEKEKEKDRHDVGEVGDAIDEVVRAAVHGAVSGAMHDAVHGVMEGVLDDIERDVHTRAMPMPHPTPRPKIW